MAAVSASHTKIWKVFNTAVDQWFVHRSARLGAALAYYSVFSMGPLLLIVISIAGLFFGADAVRENLTTQFRSLLGETGSKAVEAMLVGAEFATHRVGRSRHRRNPTAGRQHWVSSRCRRSGR